MPVSRSKVLPLDLLAPCADAKHQGETPIVDRALISFKAVVQCSAPLSAPSPHPANVSVEAPKGLRHGEDVAGALTAAVKSTPDQGKRRHRSKNILRIKPPNEKTVH